MLTKEDILAQLESFRSAVGKPVIVHSSLRSIGSIDGGADTLIDALVQFFTREGGLLCIPTHTWDENIMDLRTPRSCIGTLPHTAAGRLDGVRTMHPTHSMMVFGEPSLAAAFADHDRYSQSPAAPTGCLGRLWKEDGYVLLIGVGHNKNTFLHCVEEMMYVPGRLTGEMVERTIIHKDGSREQKYLYWFDEAKIPDVSVYFGKYEPAFRYHNCIQDAKIGNASAQLCSAQMMKETMELVRKNSKGIELLSDDTPLLPCYYTE